MDRDGERKIQREKKDKKEKEEKKDIKNNEEGEKEEMRSARLVPGRRTERVLNPHPRVRRALPRLEKCRRGEERRAE